MKKILVIEDEAVTVGIWWQMFIREGYQVDMAPDGEAALETIHCHKPDLIILDLKLPDINGIEVLKNIRAEPAFQKLPVLVFTAACDVDTLTAARNAGANQVLTKGEHTFQEVLKEVRLALAA